MNKKSGRRNRWYWALALIPLLGCLVAMVVVYRGFEGLPGTLKTNVSIDNLTQVVVPGSGEINFSKRGAYAIYYEHRSVVDGVVYRDSQAPPALACSLTSQRTGRIVDPVPDYVPTNTYFTQNRERVGVLIQSITIHEPGTYAFSCRRADGNSQPQVVLAVGPNFMWEFFSIGARGVLTVAAGLAVLLGSIAIAGLAALAMTLRRRRAEQAAASS
jgi:hypothetical protein